MKPFTKTAIAAIGLLCLGAPALGANSDGAPGASAQATVEARWVPRKLQLVYMGFTSVYSCDGLVDQMKHILRQLGAGEDLMVTPYTCVRSSGPELMAGVQASFSVLELTGSGDHANAGSPVVSAYWDPVTLDADAPRHPGSGDCELLEQVKKEVLPLFATRNLKFNSSCFPHQVSLAGAHLSVEVLRPTKPAAAPAK